MNGITLSALLLVVAIVLAIVAFFYNPNPPNRWSFIAAALAFYFLSVLFTGVRI